MLTKLFKLKYWLLFSVFSFFSCKTTVLVSEKNLPIEQKSRSDEQIVFKKIIILPGQLQASKQYEYIVKLKNTTTDSNEKVVLQLDNQILMNPVVSAENTNFTTFRFISKEDIETQSLKKISLVIGQDIIELPKPEQITIVMP